MAKKKENNTLKDCNCLNCRLSRIEDQLSDIQTVIEGRNTKKK